MTVLMKSPLEIAVCVLDLDRAATFYEKVLGFRRVSESSMGPELAQKLGFGPVTFRMVRMQTSYGERIKLFKTTPGSGPNAFPGAALGRPGINYLSFIVADLEATLERVALAGAAVMTDGPVQTRPGTRMAFFRDSEGNVLELVQHDDLSAYRTDIRSSNELA